ncbi:DMT family transporter [Serratia odorifera]|jgi:drug/metabolite transporter (DMT)-like permease|uniref:Predicted permease, DMT superfamily n=3 Tax=Serratia odorifera TaxID=618 RepID=A0A3S4HQ56_SEROD|nr:DMT family transporter [Serratia odorifera]EFE95366.1 putative membrane protein [Serratia odorifera DSM 4582]MBJ2064628.1 EamA family transporter [Serratia odorifera]PNK90024.1 EamA family transporter [Serratia odorifera]RII71101.1 EamA family transporter [Serratia odorifera]VDZ61239.1 Predicted permease, DMT superfamily [Serratia odorifera]
MPNHIILLTLFAALLHASWNTLLRGGTDRLWSMTIMCLAIAVSCALAMPFLPLPASASWRYALLSALLHVGYNLCLIRSYHSGELGQTYPIARGSAPLLVTCAAALLAGEQIELNTLGGIALVCVGILLLAFRGRKLTRPTVQYALATGVFIAAYSVVDGIGVRLSGNALSYTVWMSALWGILMPALYIALRDGKSLLRWRAGVGRAATGGVVSLLAYGIIIYAMAAAPMGAVSALRETSVLFAALLGYLFLGETLTLGKMLACTVIVSGIVIMG